MHQWTWTGRKLKTADGKEILHGIRTCWLCNRREVGWHAKGRSSGWIRADRPAALDPAPPPTNPDADLIPRSWFISQVPELAQLEVTSETKPISVPPGRVTDIVPDDMRPDHE